MANIPSDLKYADSHEWVRIVNDIATVGITDHAQHELTEVVFVELPEVKQPVAAQESCAVVESMKTASEIYSPVSGEIIAVNKELDGDPGLVNTDPYGKGWIFQVKLTPGGHDGDDLLDPGEYEALIAGN